MTNPPYMNKFEKSLKDFAKKYYKDYSKDLFSMFIYRNFDFCDENGYNALMTPFVWMFIKNYEKLRSYMINNKSISSLIQLEYSAFSEATVPICTFVLSNFDENYAGTYLKLSEFTGGMDVQKEKVLQIIAGDEVLNDKNKFIFKKENFKDIPGNPISYWINNDTLNIFKSSKSLGEIVSPKCGLKTGITEKYVKKWFEVDFNNIGFDIPSREMAQNTKLKWFPASNGGQYRKWYGNIEDVVYWYDDGYEIRNLYNPNGKLKSRPQNMQYYFKKGLSWSALTSKKLSLRITPIGNIITGAGYGLFNDNNNFNLYSIMGFLNSNIATYFSSIFSETLNFEVGILNRMPILIKEDSTVNDIVSKNILISKENWDNYEFSFDFKKHPFLNYDSNLISSSFNKFNEAFEIKFNELKHNEEKLNEFFINKYKLHEELEKFVPNDDITLFKPKLVEDIKSFVSYIIGCMFGRYSLDNEGLQFAGGDFDLDIYQKFIPDDDNIIPVLDSEYFEDDIVCRFVEFVKTCFGEENLEENLDFIADALSKNKKPSRERIRDYLLKNFFNDHKKTYKKCPIYWQFSSGKENGFNCLIYMHRYEPSLVAKIRTDYLHKTQKAIEQAITNCDNIINHSSSNSEITKATKDKNKLQKQLKETQEYDEALAHIANQNIEIDLDDGVKVNYAKFQNVDLSKEGKKSKKINLLKKL